MPSFQSFSQGFEFGSDGFCTITMMLIICPFLLKEILKAWLLQPKVFKPEHLTFWGRGREGNCHRVVIRGFHNHNQGSNDTSFGNIKLLFYTSLVKHKIVWLWQNYNVKFSGMKVVIYLSFHTLWVVSIMLMTVEEQNRGLFSSIPSWAIHTYFYIFNYSEAKVKRSLRPGRAQGICYIRRQSLKRV